MKDWMDFGGGIVEKGAISVGQGFEMKENQGSSSPILLGTVQFDAEAFLSASMAIELGFNSCKTTEEDQTET